MDANNLYGWAMVQDLPRHGLKWKVGEDFTPEEIDKLVKKDKRGYVLEVDRSIQKSCTEITMSNHF